jgi:hypothetical protein
MTGPEVMIWYKMFFAGLSISRACDQDEFVLEIRPGIGQGDKKLINYTKTGIHTDALG